MSKLPENFIQRMKAQRTDSAALFAALDEDPPVSIRLNPFKKINQFGNESTVPWCTSGRYLTERPSFTKDPLFHAGTYYPQEAGSMFIDAILKQIELPESCVALDLCAAPGGKSTILLDNLSNQSLLISNEIVRNRAYILRDNLTRWGASNVIVTNKNAADFDNFKGLLDVVLIDAPCSGEGMFRKDLNARDEWSLKNAAQCTVRQNEILRDIWPALKGGAYLIYSTCTFNPEENHLQLKKFMQEYDCELVTLNFPDSFNLDTFENEGIGFSCYPHKMKTEGFYFAVLRKLEATRNFQAAKSKEKNKKQQVKQAEQAQIPSFTTPEGHEIVSLNNTFYLVPKLQKSLMLLLQEQLGCMKFGTCLGEVIGGKWNPHYEYALSNFPKNEFSNTEFSINDALSFLKGNPIELEGKDGWHLATFEGHGLGWLKKIGARSNNYYPKELRIKMEI